MCDCTTGWLERHIARTGRHAQVTSLVMQHCLSCVSLLRSPTMAISWQTIEELDIEGLTLEQTFYIRIFPQLPKLRRLNVQDTDIEFSSLRKLAAPHALRSLNIYRCKFNDLAVERLPTLFPNLNTLIAGSASSFSGQVIRGFSSLARLTALHLRHQITITEKETEAIAKGCVNLRRLELYQCVVKENCFNKLWGCNKLEWAMFWGVKILEEEALVRFVECCPYVHLFFLLAIGHFYFYYHYIYICMFFLILIFVCLFCCFFAMFFIEKIIFLIKSIHSFF